MTPLHGPAAQVSPEPEELLIREAQQVTRRRRLSNTALFAVVVGVIVALLIAGSARSNPTSTVARRGASSGPFALAACTPGTVTIANGPSVSPASQEEPHVLRLTNSGARACVVDGYVTIRFLNAEHRVLPFTFSHRPTGGYQLTTAPAHAITLGRHQSAYVLFAQTACVEGYRELTTTAAISMPRRSGSVKPLQLERPMAYCKGANAATENTVALSPIEPTVRATLGPIPK